MNNNRKLFVFIAVVALLCLLCILFIFFFDTGGEKKAGIYINNELYKTVDLSDSAIDMDFLIETQYGFNRIIVHNGMICVSEADCPDKTCVKTGWTDSSVNPVICIPHRLEIVIEDFSEIDGVSG